MPAQRLAMPPTLLSFLATIMACAELEKACTASTRRAGHTAPEDVRPCIFVSQFGTGYRAEARSPFSDEATRGELEACDSSLGSWGDPLPPSQPTADERSDLTFDDKRNACLEDYICRPLLARTTGILPDGQLEPTNAFAKTAGGPPGEEEEEEEEGKEEEREK